MHQTFVIIGGGLAGIFMSYRLIQAGQKVILIDDQAPQGASRIAAGLFNVVTGRYGTKSWMADTLMTSFNEFIHQPGLQSLLPFVHKLPIYRPFRDIREYNKWLGRSVNPRYRNWVRFQEKPLRPDVLNNPYGGVEVLGCGWVDTGNFIQALQNILEQNPHFSYFPTFLKAEKIDLPNRKINIDTDSIAFDQLILCSGYQSHQHQLWQDIPVIPNKGELLQIEAKGLDLDFIFSKKVFLIPVGKDNYLVGSTYTNEFTHSAPSEEGKAEICANLDEAINIPYQVVDHKAGIRPTTADRRPILGTHRGFDYVHIFTGLGTKGVLQAPYFSQLLTDYLIRNKSLPLEVDIKRFAVGSRQ